MKVMIYFVNIYNMEHNVVFLANSKSLAGVQLQGALGVYTPLYLKRAKEPLLLEKMRSFLLEIKSFDIVVNAQISGY